MQQRGIGGVGVRFGVWLGFRRCLLIRVDQNLQKDSPNRLTVACRYKVSVFVEIERYGYIGIVFWKKIYRKLEYVLINKRLIS
jgi:hypothetical protein